MATQQERTSESRGALVDATVALLAAEGRAGVTYNRLEAVTGLSRGLVSYHFGSRQGLLDAVLEQIATDFVRDLVDAPALADCTGLEAVVALVDLYLAELDRDPARNTAALLLITESLHDAPGLQTAVRELDRTLRAGLAGQLRRGADDGSVHAKVQPDAAAAVLLAVLRGTALQWTADRAALDLIQLRAEAVRSVRAAYSSTSRAGST